jgi:hypothetical protein
MIARYNNRSLLFGIPGILLQMCGVVAPVAQVPGHPEIADMLFILLRIVGTILLMIGLGYYAKAKGRNSAWCFMGFLSCFGLLFLAIMKDLAPNGEEPKASDSNDQSV